MNLTVAGALTSFLHSRKEAIVRSESCVRCCPVSGALAQLGEHLLCKQGVVGSIPTGSTSFVVDGMIGAHDFDLAQALKLGSVL
jgi:hypothetical protein